MHSPCPYCNIRSRSSDDHIFPDFLGGRTTIRTCKQCNDVFGHSFEGAVCADLAPMVITLRTAGLLAPKAVVWRRAFQDADSGIDYDLDSNLGAQSSKPIIERDENGNVRAGFFHDEKMKKKFISRFEKKGRRVSVADRGPHTIATPPLEFQLTVGMELRRLAVKMAFAVAEHLGNGVTVMDGSARMFLLGEAGGNSRTILDMSVYQEVEAWRSPISHLAYVEGSNVNHSCYGIVQFYGLVQIYVILNEGSYGGPEFACLGILSPAQGYAETFKNVTPCRLPTPPVYFFERAKSIWLEKFGSEVREAFGEKSPTFKMKPTPSSYSSTATLTTFLTPPHGKK